MVKKVKHFIKKALKEVGSHKLEYILLFVILSFSAFFRLFRLDKLLGFWYDQGRDALIIWDLLHYRRFFLIGPVTGIEGIFLGPFYYYLLAPLYWLGKGSPVFAASGLSCLTVGTIFLIYWLGKKMFGSTVGLLAAFLYGFSYNNVVFSRWLANPNPLPFFVLLVLIFLYRFIEEGNFKFLVISAFLVSLCLQLEAASAVFFLPSILVILIWQRKKVTFKVLFWSFLVFFITLIPQIYFNFRHEGILVTAFKKFLVEEKSFKFSFSQIIHLRLLTYYEVFTSKLISDPEKLKPLVLALFSAPFILFRKKIFSKESKFLLIWLFVPLLGYIFYQGNHGYVWDYYFTGIIPAFFLLFSLGLYYLIKRGLLGKIIVYVFLIAFTIFNLRSIKNYLKIGIEITLGSQTRAIDWIYKEADNQEFNVDVYVPPQIFYSYTYLFRWYGKEKYGKEPETKLVKNLFTLSEPNDQYPHLLQAWLKRQDGIGRIEKSYFWGDITVQKRERFKLNE